MTPMRLRMVALISSVIIVLATLVVVTILPNFWPQIFGFAGPTVTALLVLARLEEYHAAVNSKMDRLLITTAAASRAEGILHEQETNRRDVALRTPALP